MHWLFNLGQALICKFWLLKAAGADVLFELTVDEFGDGVGNDAPYFKAVAEEADVGGMVVGVVGHQPVGTAALFEALDGKLAVDSSNHNVAGLGLDGAVDGDEGPVGDMGGGAVHASAFDASHVSRIGVGQQDGVEVHFGTAVLFGGAGKAGGDGRFALDYPEGLPDNLEDFDGSHKNNWGWNGD